MKKDYPKFGLVHCAAMATGVLAVSESYAQVVYTDIEPDIILFQEVNDDEGPKYLDMDDDGTNDIMLHYEVFYGCGYCPYQTFFDMAAYGQHEIAYTYDDACLLTSSFSDTCYFPPVKIANIFMEGEMVGASEQWDKITHVFQEFMCGYPYGDACRQTDFPAYTSGKSHFLGVRLITTDTNYCWIRLRTEGGKVLIKDYACSSIADSAIEIHDKVADEVKDLQFVADTCTGNTDELHVLFNPPLDENSVSEYRIMVAPAYGFSPDEALLVSPSNYISVIPDGGPVSVRLPADFTNYIGEPLPSNYDIRITVFSIYKTPVSTECSLVLSMPAKYAATGYADAPESIHLAGSPSTYTSADINVSSTDAINLSKSASFRIILVKSVETPGFTLENAISVLPENYLEIPATSGFSINLPENMRDWKGDLMEANIFYKAVVLAMPELGTTCISEMSDFSGSAKFFNDPLSVNDPSSTMTITYAASSIKIQSPGPINGRIKIYALNGSLIFDQNCTSDNIVIPFGHSSGVYFLKIETANRVLVKKISAQ